jgi:hypothetical protein
MPSSKYVAICMTLNGLSVLVIATRRSDAESRLPTSCLAETTPLVNLQTQDCPSLFAPRLTLLGSRLSESGGSALGHSKRRSLFLGLE